MVQKRFIVCVLLLIGSISSVSLFSLLHYFDPYMHILGAMILLGCIFLSLCISFGGLGMYMIKNIYFRGNVSCFHILSSMRQALFVGIVIMVYVACISLQIPYYIPVFGTLFFLLSCELLIQSMYT